MSPSNDTYASVIINECLGIRNGEEVLIFTDDEKRHFSDELAFSIKNCGANVSIFYIPETIRPLEKITTLHALSLVAADAVIYILEVQNIGKNLAREVAFRDYLFSLPLDYKGRVCMMPGFSDKMKDSVVINYSRLNERCESLKNILNNKFIRITSEKGTDIRFSLLERRIKIENGQISKSGTCSNIPAGEIFTAPVEETVNGKVVVDGSIGNLGQVKNPFTVSIYKGNIIDVEPSCVDEIFQEFSFVINYDPPNTKCIGEFGIGLNPKATLTGTMLSDEKVEGTVHFAFGDSYGLGKTKSKYHTDVLIMNPTIYVENQCIMEKGKFLINI